MKKKDLNKYLNLPALNGELYVVAGKEQNDKIGEVIILGNSKGLSSLGKLFIAMSKINQNKLINLPRNESEHIHLEVGNHIGKGKLNTHNLIISRLDMKNGKLKPYYKSRLKKERKILEMRKIAP